MLHVFTQRIAGTELEAHPVRTVVTDSVVNTGGTLGAQQHGTDTILIERIQGTQRFGGQFIDTTETDGPPVIAFQSHIGGTVPVFPFLGQRSVIQIEPSFQFESGFLAGTQIFRTAKTDPVIDIGTHPGIGTVFLDETGIDHPVNDDIGLGIRHAGSGAHNG